MIYDEEKVPQYTLPDPAAGISSAQEFSLQRSHLLKMFSQTMYGDILPRPQEMKIELLESDSAEHPDCHADDCRDDGDDERIGQRLPEIVVTE